MGHHPAGEWEIAVFETPAKSITRPSHIVLCRFQALMGVFFYIHSVALVEDLAVEEHYTNPDEFFAAADKAFMQVRQNPP